MVLHPEFSVKYFTAKIVERVSKGADSVSSQAIYHNALRAHCKEQIEIVEGYYSVTKVNQHAVSLIAPNRWPRDCERVSVWKVEEKQTDVNLALQMFDDAISGDVDQVILVTNDTDLSPALKMIKDRCPRVVRGLVIPTTNADISGGRERRASGELVDLANWTRHGIQDDELRKSQLPDVVQGKRKASVKPISWYPRPDLIEEMIKLVLPVLNKHNKVMKWARESNQHFDGASPLEMLETDEGAIKVFEYIKAYKE